MSQKRAPRRHINFKIVEENRLIDLVRRYEELYDPRQRMRDMHVRKKIWTEIGVKLGKSDIDCAQKWRCIKQDYMNRLRGLMAHGRYDVSRLSFLDEFIKKTPRTYTWKKNASSGTETSEIEPKIAEHNNVLPEAADNNIILEQIQEDNNEIQVDIMNDFIIRESVDGDITLDLVPEDCFGDGDDSSFEEESNGNVDSIEKDTTPDNIPEENDENGDEMLNQERLNAELLASMSRPFTNDEENRLIDLVKKNQKLYHPRHKTYPKQKKMEVWTAIGVELGKTARVCRREWLAIKRGYQKSLQDRTVDSTKRYDKERLSFLGEFTRIPLTFRNPDDRSIPIRSTSYFQQSNNKFGFFHDQLNICSASELELFFHWVYKSVGSLPLNEQARIRIEINKLVVNASLRRKK